MKKFKISILFLSLTILLSSCSLASPKPQKQDPVAKKTRQEKPINNDSGKIASEFSNGVKKFADLDELKEFLEEGSGGISNSYGTKSMRGFAEPMMADMVVNESIDDIGINYQSKALTTTNEASLASGGGSDDYSKTNVQVEGVDEADIIKTDGEYIYALVQSDLYIIKAYPTEDSEIISKIAFKSRPTNIYINENRLVVFGQNLNKETFRDFKRRSQFSFFKVFDISDKKNPKQVRDLDFEGNYSNSRMIGDYVYFITNNYNYYYISGEPILPRLLDGGEALSVDCSAGAKCFAPDVYYFDIPYNSYNFTSVNVINIRDESEDVDGEIYIMPSGQNIYASLKNIYLTYTKYISEEELAMGVARDLFFPRLSARNQDRIEKIEATEDFILNDQEKLRKVMQILERFAMSLSEEDQVKAEKDLKKAMQDKYEDISKELEKTIIHKIAINKGKLEYKTSGEVTGHLLNQFSMDESDGYFRLATTKNRSWSSYIKDDEAKKSYNNIYVLGEDLEQVGEIEKLAVDERIYSIRFMQNRAYMVTFKQIDPLFVIDLSNPKKPKVLGELKIPGYSNYLHPYDENTLIGFGKDAGESEWGSTQVKGLKLSLFDVSNVKKPKEIDTYIMGDAGSNSIALNDHKAFLFSKEKNLLSIPVTIRESLNGRWGKLSFSGVVVLNVDKNGFKLKGKIDHSDGGRASGEDYWGGYRYYDNTVKRSLYIDDTLYTFSNKYIKMNKLSDLEEVKKLELKKLRSGEDDDFEIVN